MLVGGLGSRGYDAYQTQLYLAKTDGYAQGKAAVAPAPSSTPRPQAPVRSDGSAPSYVASFLAHLCDADLAYLAANSTDPQPTTRIGWASHIGRQGADCAGYEYAGATSTGYAYVVNFVNGEKVMYLFEFQNEKFSGLY